MGFVHRTITKTTDKKAATYQFRCCGRSNLVILIKFLSNFIYGLLSSNLGSSLNMGFVWWTITKKANKMPAVFQFRCCARSSFVIVWRISFKLHIYISATAHHFHSADHDFLSHASVCCLEHNKEWSDTTRKLRESYWIRRLNTLCPFGINKGDWLYLVIW